MTTVSYSKSEHYLHCVLTLENGEKITIPTRQDGFIHATKLCQVVKKRIGNWSRLSETKELISKVSNSTKNCVEVYKGNSINRAQGTWVHPDLGINLAQWCSPNFGLQVSRWVRELLLTTKVSIGAEKSDSELQTIVNKLTAELEVVKLEKQGVELQKQQLESRHQTLLKKRTQHKFKKGPCFYIMGNRSHDSFTKPGYTGNLSERSVYYLTASPCTFKIMYACFTPYAKNLEETVQNTFVTNRQENREGIYNVPVFELIQFVRSYLALTKYEHEEIDDYDQTFDYLMNRGDGTFAEMQHCEKLQKTIQNLTQPTKQCPRCKKIKDKTDFGKDLRRPDGLSCYCKPCKTAQTQESKTKHKIKIDRKQCRKCLEIKPVEQFSVQSSSTDGRHSHCKKCFNDSRNGQGDVKCPHCDLVYKNKDSLGVHLWRKHRDSTHSLSNAN